MKKRRKQTPRERALVRVVNEAIRVYNDNHRCHDCCRDDGRHEPDCIVTTLRAALRVR